MLDSKIGGVSYKNKIEGMEKVLFKATEFLETIYTRLGFTETRPMKGESVKTIYSFEVLLSTEWNFPLSFAPNVFFDITDTLNTKLKAMNIYKNEIRDDTHPRSSRGIITNTQFWGLRAGLEYAEAFELIRNVK